VSIALSPLAGENLTSILETRIGGRGDDDKSAASPSAEGGDGLSAIQNITFSLGMFSIHDDAAAGSLQFRRTSDEVASSPIGANEVDGDTIYRILSVSKLVTVYAGLLNFENADWERPLTDFFPQLAEVEDDPSTTCNGTRSPLLLSRRRFLACHVTELPMRRES
jgi:hypothetical protein